jgi:hypothetical protein
MIAPLAIVGFAAFLALGGVVVRWLWNWLMPVIFGLPMVTFWQALGLLALSRILFGGFRFRGRRPGWDRLSPEERERIRSRMRERWSTHGAPGSTPSS